MSIIPKSTTFRVAFLMVDASDDETAETGLSPTVQISKNGGSFSTVTNSVTEIANGWYRVDLTTTETNTEGPLIVRATGTGANEWRNLYHVFDLTDFHSTLTNAGIADAVWDEAVSGHTGTGSFGEEVQLHAQSTEIPSEPPTAAAVADAVWDEQLSGHTTAGSGGKVLSDKADPGDQMTLSDGAITAAKIASSAITDVKIATGAITSAKFAAGAIDAAAIAANAIGASELATDAIAEIADGVWDELLSGHTTAGSAGKALSDAGVSAADIADAVWDESLAAHQTAGSTGEALDAAGGSLTAAAVADAVWDELKSGHNVAGSFGEEVQAHALSTEFPDETAFKNAIADQVWLEQVSDHSGTSGSTAEALDNAAAASAAAIADAVWDEALGSHTTAGTAGKKLYDIDPADLTVIHQVGMSTSERLVAQVGATFSYTFTGLTIASDWLRVVFVVKENRAVADEFADIYILESNPADSGNDGTVFIAGNPIDASQQTLSALTVNQSGGEIAVDIDEELTELIGKGNKWYALKIEHGASKAAADEDIVKIGEFIFDRHAVAEALVNS